MLLSRSASESLGNQIIRRVARTIVGENRRQTGRSPVSGALGNEGKALLSGIGCGLFGPPSLSRNKPAQSRVLERSDKFGGSERSTRVRTLAQHADFRG